MINSDIKIKRQDMLAIFSEMGHLCQKHSKHYEIAIYGGSALMLSFEYREATADIDFMPISGAAHEIKKIANQAAANLGMATDTMRDDVEVFASDVAAHEIYGEFPKGTGNLRVFTATPEYIFSMKMLSMRSSVETQDLRDVWELADACNIPDIKTACELLAKFYPEKKLPRRNYLLLEDLFEAKRQNKPYSPAMGW